MKLLFASLRLVAGLAIVVAIVAQFIKTASMTRVNPFNFFGFFTIQGNIITAVAFLTSAALIFGRREQPMWLSYLRALATVLMAIIGIVYNTLLREVSMEGAFNLQWSNDILHLWIPIYAVVDWVLFDDRRVLPFRRLWILLIHPILWLGVVLVRGATDGWVPYPFLDPALGYATVGLYCIAIAALTILFGYGVYALTRVRLISPGPAPEIEDRVAGVST